VLLLGARLQDAHPDVRKKPASAARPGGEQGASPARPRRGMRVLAGQDGAISNRPPSCSPAPASAAAKRLSSCFPRSARGVHYAAWHCESWRSPNIARHHKYVGEEFARVIAASAAGRKTLLGNLIDHQLSQLNQLLGKRDFAPPSRCAQFVPKRDFVGESRAAAVWALA